MLSRWILAFGMRREQPKTRRAKEPAKPRLEELTQRILLSAAASPQMAEEAMQIVATMMQEQYQLIVTVEDNFVQTYDTYIQRLAQLWASDVQQWKKFVGIEPPSGSGSGSGTITPTDNSPNQPPVAIQPKSGSGTGSGAITSHENPSKSGSMPMSGSCGSGSSGSVPVVYFGSGSNPFYEESIPCMSNYATRSPMLSFSNCHDVTVDYYTVDGTAKAGIDYVGVGSGSGIGSVTIPAGQVSAPQPIEIKILDDGNDEDSGTQDFYVVLTRPTGATLGNSSTDVKIAERKQNATDTLRWVPCDGNNASTVTNWVDIPPQGAPFRLDAGSQGPNPLSPIQFDAKATDDPNSNKPITWDKNFTVASISLIQYTGLQTIGNVTVESKGANGTALSMDGKSWLSLYYLGGTYQIDNNATITNMSLAQVAGSGAKFVINGGTTTIAQSHTPPYTDEIGVQFYINAGATLNDQSYNSLTFTADNVQINVEGTMNTFYSGIVLIDNGGKQNNYINVNGGTLAYSGAGGITDTFNVPVYVFGGTFKLNSAQGQSIGGKLIVKDLSGYKFPNGAMESVYVTGPGSTVQLAQAATLECDSDFYLDHGILETTDATTCTLQDGAQGGGTATVVSGGIVDIAISSPDAPIYGELDMKAATLQFGGQLAVQVSGYDPTKQQQGQQDLLKVVGGIFNLNPQASSTLSVGAQTPQNGDQWIIINSTNITSSTKTINFGTMTSLKGTANAPIQGQYQVQFNG